jgi:dihydrofolate synthase/folylpolyglutamate synthase
MDLESSLKKLYSLHTFGIKLGLDSTVDFLNYLGNPQKELKTIHIAGSNGKGSTASFIASILQEFGFKVGLYTSPHFVNFNERVVINGKQIEDEYISSFISANEKYIDQHELTFFEVTTAMAFQYFSEMSPDYCIIETGLGGRLDATNVLDPLAVVITSISLEHTNVLGNTIEKIASEKAAIIKKGPKVFSGILSKEAANIIHKRCEEMNCELYELKDFISDDAVELNILLGKKSIKLIPPLKGNYQRRNSALAAMTISKTFHFEDEQKYLKGISNVCLNTGLQGRYEYYHKNPTIIFDSAHNPEGIASFISEFQNEAGNFKRRVLIFGAMRDKAIKDMLLLLAKSFDEIMLAEINYDRAAKPAELMIHCDRLNISSKIIEKPAKFIEDFKSNAHEECLVVLGSMYLLGEIKQQLLHRTT